MKRSPLKRGTARLRRRTALKQIGRRAQSETLARAEMRDTVISETGGACVARRLIPEIRCWGGTEVHELIDRSLRPGVHLDPTFGVTLCHAHHLYVSDDPTRARDLGLSFNSFDPDEARERARQLKADVWRL